MGFSSVMFGEELTKRDIERLLQYRLILIEASKDDPVIEAHMILELEDAYKNLHLKIPSKINSFLQAERLRISPLITERIRKKTYEYKITEDARDLFLKKKYESEQFNSPSEDNSLSRTEKIFGKDSGFI